MPKPTAARIQNTKGAMKRRAKSPFPPNARTIIQTINTIVNT